MGRINTAIVGVGNCASLFVQGLEYYRDAATDQVPGLMHPVLGGYKISDIAPVVAFDVDSRKVGMDMSRAILEQPNNTVKVCDVAPIGAPVLKGPVLDGVGEYLGHVVPLDAKQKPVSVAKELEERGVDVVVSLLPVGSAEATRFYAEETMKAGCGFVNCIPEFIASDAAWSKKFEDAGVPVVGDDIKSMVGATIVHRAMTKLCMDRGATIDRTYQLNVGGNTDFYNMLERTRLKSKKISKTESVQSQMLKRLPDAEIHIGPSDYVPWLKSRKLCFLRIEGRLFADVPFNAEIRLDVEDKANAAGIIVDAVRCCKLGTDRGIAGALTSPSAYFMKHPPQQFPDSVAREMLEEFIRGSRER